MKQLMCREEFDTLSRLKSQYFESKTKDFTIPKTLKGFRNKILKVCMKDSYEYNSYISRKLGTSSGSKTSMLVLMVNSMFLIRLIRTASFSLVFKMAK